LISEFGTQHFGIRVGLLVNLVITGEELECMVSDLGFNVYRKRFRVQGSRMI